MEKYTMEDLAMMAIQDFAYDLAVALRDFGHASERTARAREDFERLLKTFATKGPAETHRTAAYGPLNR